MRSFSHWLRTLGVALATALCATTSVLAQESDPQVVGSWQGTLRAGGRELQIVYRISRADDGLLTGTMDVPTQGAQDIPLDSIVVTDTTVSWTFPVPGGGSYEGTFALAGEAIHGTFSQGPASVPLDLERTDGTSSGPSRPQEPVPPFPYDVDEVRFVSAPEGVALAGTVTMPRGDGPFPAAVLISGAGSQDRDGSMFGHKPLLVLADHLTRQGIAVLRFDDRGAGESGGDGDEMTPENLAADALAGVALLAERNGIDGRRVGLIAHSDGAIAATLAAAQSGSVKFLVLLGARGLPAIGSLASQVERVGRASGLPDALIELNRSTYPLLARIAVSESDRDTAAEQMRVVIREELGKLSADQRKIAEQIMTDQTVEQTVREFNQPWSRFVFRYDPRDALARVSVPTLALIGERDLQVIPERHLSAIAEAVRSGGNEDITAQILPGLNHFFQEAETGSPAEFGQIEQTLSPAALEVVSAWIGERQP